MPATFPGDSAAFGAHLAAILLLFFLFSSNSHACKKPKNIEKLRESLISKDTERFDEFTKYSYENVKNGVLLYIQLSGANHTAHTFVDAQTALVTGCHSYITRVAEKISVSLKKKLHSVPDTEKNVSTPDIHTCKAFALVCLE